MRAATVPILLSVLLVLTSNGLALELDKGKIVQGRYFASGSASVAGVKVQYLRSKASVNNRGRVKGLITKVISSKGVVLSSARLKIRGHVNSLSRRRGSFTAPTTIRLSDGVTIRGDFQGLVDRSQRLSRYFRGKINGDSNSNFVLRAR